MRKPPPIRDARRYPVTASIALLAIGISILCWVREPELERFVTDVRAFHGEPWRLVSSAFPHGNGLHLLFNLGWTWALGTVIEEKLGKRTLAVVSFILALSSGAAEYALDRGGIGLSGIVYGYFTLVLVLSRRDPRFVGAIDKQNTRLMIGWFFFCIVATRLGWLNVGNVAHGAGALVGVLLGFAWTTSFRRLLYVATTAFTLAAVVVAWKFRGRVNLAGAAGRDAARLGYLELKAERPREALRWMREAVAIKPSAEHWYALAVVEFELEDLPSAREHFQRAHDLAPDEPRYKEALEFTRESKNAP